MASQLQAIKVPIHVIKRMWGLTKGQVERAGVRPYNCDFGIGYDLEEVWHQCKDTIAEILATETDVVIEGSEQDLKRQKTVEEIRKLRLLNDQNAGTLVKAASVSVMAVKAYKAITDVLDSIPSQVRMENPDVTQAMLDTIAKCIGRARNNCAEIELEDVPDE